MPDDDPFVWPYTPTPGGGTPPVGTGRAEGRHEVKDLFILSLLSTIIIAAVGITVWFLLHSPTR
jgi:hypothetical protein